MLDSLDARLLGGNLGRQSGRCFFGGGAKRSPARNRFSRRPPQPRAASPTTDVDNPTCGKQPVGSQLNGGSGETVSFPPCRIGGESAVFSLRLATALSLASPLLQVQAAITATGDVSPANPSTWTGSSTTGYIGNTGTGSVTVDGGSSLNSEFATIGNQPGSTGVATVTGTGSAWSNSYGITIGSAASGTLNVTASATLRSNASNYAGTFDEIGYSTGSTGLVTVDGAGSTWTQSGTATRRRQPR